MRDAVVNERTFVDFLDALSMDWSSHQSDQATAPASMTPLPGQVWQNHSIGTFLDAAVMAGDQSINSVKDFEHPPNHWHRAACILYAGKRYD